MFKKLFLLLSLCACSVESAKVPVVPEETDNRSVYSMNVYSEKQDLKSKMFFWKDKESMPQVIQLTAKLGQLEKAIKGLMSKKMDLLAIKTSILVGRMGDDNLQVYNSFFEQRADEEKTKAKFEKMLEGQTDPNRIAKIKAKIEAQIAKIVDIDNDITMMQDAYLSLEDLEQIKILEEQMQPINSKILSMQEDAEATTGVFLSSVDMMEDLPDLQIQIAEQIELRLKGFAAHPSQECSTTSGSIMGASLDNEVLTFTAICRQRGNVPSGKIDAYIFELERVDQSSSKLQGNFVRCTNTKEALLAGDCGLARYGVAVFQ